MTGNAWPLVSLGEIAHPISRPVGVLPGQTYRTIGVKWWGEGAYERETIDGSQTAAKTLSVVRKGDLIINKIWVRHGSTAIVSAEVDGCVGSGEFPTFELDQTHILLRWMHWMTKTRAFWLKCDKLSQGTSGKNRIKPELFLTITIPLPSLDDQRRIVVRIEELATRIEEARELRKGAMGRLDKLWAGTLRTAYTVPDVASMTLEAVCEAIVDNLHSTPVYDGDDFPCIRSQDIGWGTVDFGSALRTSEREFFERTRRGEPQEGDIVYVREGDVGRCALVDGSQRFCLGQRVMMLRPNARLIRSDFLMYQLMTPQVLDGQILTGKTGTTSHHVNIKYIRGAEVRVPPMGIQAEVADRVLRTRANVDAARCLQAETAAELDALLPSILDRAFRGELV
jgi:type I restriction enzyme, S subunit